MTGGKVVLRNAAPKTMEVVLDKLSEAGAIIEAGDNWISIDMQQRPESRGHPHCSSTQASQPTCRRSLWP